MKKLNNSALVATTGGYTCAPVNGNGQGAAIGTCFPSLCVFVGSILANNPSASDVFQVCPF
jgi:hypothetical protein